jgi:hypothetical protein
VQNCKSFIVTEAEREHVRRRARNFNNIETEAFIKYFFPAKQSAEVNNNNIYLTAIELSPGGSGYLTCIQI